MLFVAFLVFPLKAQVTIGLDENPVEGAILQLKEITGITDSTLNAYRGLALPRVTLSDKNALYPMFLTDPANPGSSPITGYTNDKAAIDKSHTGLVVYNLVEDESLDLYTGINVWNGTQWVSFQPRTENAKFGNVVCAGIEVNGVYIQDAPATSANYLRITFNVTKTGAYTIMVHTKTENGYSFYLSGMASSTGTMTVNVPCQGTPRAAKSDTLVFSGVTLADGCVPTVTVAEVIADYSMNCSSVAVNGTFQKGAALTTQTITLNVTATTAGSYNISTPLTNGIRFAGSGTLAVGTQTISLAGSGTPAVSTDFPVTINANSVPESTCSTTIPVILPAMTYAVIAGAGGSSYTWDGSPGTGSPRGAALKTAANFGPEGKVKIAGLTQIWSNTDPATVTANLNNSTIPQPDIVLFFAYQTPFPNPGLITALINYVNKGGCLIYATPDSGTDNLNSVNALLNGIFPGSNNIAQPQIAGSITVDDNDYLIANLPNDPIINGPFGNLSTQYYWGEDNGSTGSTIVTALPANSVQICSANNPFGKTNVNPSYSIVWYNTVKGFVYFGDSVGSLVDDGSTRLDSYPSVFNSAYAPLAKMYGNWPNPAGSPPQYTYVAALELNAVAWALQKAAASGINSY